MQNSSWIKLILPGDGDSARFQIAHTKLHVPIVTLSTKDNSNMAKQLSEGYKRPVYWNSYQTKPAKVIGKGKNIYDLLSASFQGVRRLFVLAYFIAAPARDNPADDETGIKNTRKYFLSRGEIENYNVLIDGRNFYDQPINDLIKQYNEVSKV